MAQNEVKASASIDTKPFEQGTARMGDHIKKFAFETEGVMSKLARQLSLTDVAAAAVFTTMQKAQQIVADSIAAYEKQQKAIGDATGKATEYTSRMNELNEAIKQNNVALGESLSPWKIFTKELETQASTTLVAWVNFFREFDKWRAGGKNPVGMGVALGQTLGWFGTGSAPPPAARPTPRFDTYGPSSDQYYRALENEASERNRSYGYNLDRITSNYIRDRRGGYPRPIPMGGNPFDMGYLNGQPGVDMRKPARYGEGTPGAFSTFEDYQKYLERMDKVNQVTQQFGQNLVTTLMDTYSRGGNIMKAIGSTIVDTLKSVLSDLAGQAIGSALSGFLGGALGIKPGVSGKAFSGAAVEPAMQRMAARSIMPGLAYETRRGRGF